MGGELPAVLLPEVRGPALERLERRALAVLRIADSECFDRAAQPTAGRLAAGAAGARVGASGVDLQMRVSDGLRQPAPQPAKPVPYRRQPAERHSIGRATKKNKGMASQIR